MQNPNNMTNTFQGWAAGSQGQPLSEESKQKVMLITDINKAVKLVNGQDISSREFDYLYDMSLSKLQEHDNQMKLGIEADKRFNDYMSRAHDSDAE